MGLANDAANAARGVADAAAQREAARLQGVADTYVALIEAFGKHVGLDAPVVHLGSERGGHPERRRQQFGGDYLGTEYHEIHRVRLDDLVLVGGLGPATESELARRVGIEQPCKRCGKPAYVHDFDLDLSVTTYRGEAKPAEATKAQFLRAVGDLVRGEHLCWNCRADVGDACEYCHRRF